MPNISPFEWSYAYERARYDWPGADYRKGIREPALEWLLSEEGQASVVKLGAALIQADQLPYSSEERSGRQELIRKWFKAVMMNARLRHEPVITD